MALRHGIIYNQFRGHSLDTKPAVEPITLTEVKAQIGLDTNDDDTILTLYIEASRNFAETITGLSLITQKWLMTIDRWPMSGGEWWDGVRDGAIGDLQSTGRAQAVYLPRYPLQSIETMTADSQAITVADVFVVDTQEKPGRLVLKSGSTFPPVSESANGIQILYVSGYGLTAADVPADLRLALIMMVAHLYGHRGDECSTEDAYKLSGCQVVFDRYKAARL